ncbi:DUF4073 domain-containing protein [Cohnella sp. GCM10012308]|uniref:DUF4073 domain-containing protein n=1 Tax=Cohnella sp. GCM10012308 TaxID=3317329 RepID=UPI003609267C
MLALLLVLGQFTFYPHKAAAADNLSWTALNNSPLGSGQQINDVIYDGGRFVAVSQGLNNRQIVTSVDGGRWTNTTNDLTTEAMVAVAYGGGIYIAVGNGGVISRSTDGVNWSKVAPSPTSNSLTMVKYLNNKFWAVGVAGTVMSSTDGLTWSVGVYPDVSATNTIIDIDYKDGKYAVGDSNGKVYFSTTGASGSWGSGTSLAPAQKQINYLSNLNGIWFAIDANGKVYKSTDGSIWSSFTLSKQVFGAAYGNGTYVIYSQSGGSVFTSTDASTWTEVSLPSGATWYGMTYGNGAFILVGNNGYILRSTDGTNWTTVDPFVNQAIYNNGLYVAVGNNSPSGTIFGTILSSTDGRAWTNRLTTVGNLTSVAYGNNRYAAVGTGGKIYTSADGINWISVATTNTTENLAGIRYVNGMFMAVGANGTLVVSTDGTTWTAPGSTGLTGSLTSVAYGNGKYLISGNTSSLWYSSDGATWEKTTAGSTSAIAYNDVIYAGNKFVAAGGSVNIYTSTDGVIWTQRKSGTGIFNSLAYENGMYVAVGTGGMIYSSTDGETWTAETSNVSSILKSVHYDGSRFFAIGAYLGMTTAAYGATASAELQTAEADGAAGTTTSTKIDLTFDTDVAGLTDADITITNGTGAAVKGALTGSGKNWSIALSSVATEGNVSVAVASPNGYTIGGSPKTVSVYKASSQPDFSGKIFWTDYDNNSIVSMDVGSLAQTIMVNDASAKMPNYGPYSGALDADTGKVYWFEDGYSTIRRANYDGSDVEDLFTGLSNPSVLALDKIHNKLYISDYANGIIKRANLDGTDLEQVVIATEKTGQYGASNLSIDAVNGKIYWFEDGYNTIRSANLDGTDVKTLFTGVGNPTIVSVDQVHRKLYLADYAKNAIERSDLDGSNKETVIEVVSSDNNSGAASFALDAEHGKMYWFDDGESKFKRADLDGSNVETIFNTSTYITGIFMPSRTPPLYSFGLSETGNHEFATASADYAAPTPYNVTVSNSGTEAAGPLTIALTGTNANSFALSKSSIGSIAAGGSDSFTAVPNTGLTPGNYSATVIVAGGSLSKSFTVSFTVTATGNTFTVVNTNDSGPGSLRWAIAQAGAVADGKVVFDPALAGQTITLASDLTGWDELASEGTTIGNDSTNFTLTGLKDASGLPAITVDGNGHAGIRATGSGSFSLSDIRFTGFELNDSTGVYNGSGAVLAVSGSDYSSVTISNVRFDHNRMTSENNTSIVALSNDAHIDRVVFADNELNAFRAGGPAYQATLLFMETQNGEITNSLFFNNSTSSHTSGDAYGGTIGNFMDFNLKVVNNTFYGNSVSNTGTGQALGPVGYAIESNVSSVEFYNNLMIDNIAQGQTVSAFGTVFYDDGGKVTTPNGNNVYAGFPFIDAIGGDFRLASSATGAIDQGDDSKSVGSFDLSGKARKVGSAVEIGAFEYVPGPVSNDASLTSILGKTDAAPGGGAGTYSDPITWSINVANNVTKLDKADIVPADSNAIVWFYDNSDFTSGSVYGVRSLNLPAGGSATAYIQIDSGSATRYYAVTVNRAAAAAPAYTINGTSQPWQDATLAADGDVLEITTDDSPASATRIHVTAPAGSTVTLKGKAGKIYDNVHVLVDEPITLKLENFNIAAPAGDTYNGIGLVKHNSPGDIVLETAGSNTIEGFNGIFSDSNHQLTINGTGTITAKGRAAADPAADSGNGIYLLSDNTSGNTNPVASLTVDGSVMVKAYGGDSVSASGGNGIALNWGNLLIKSGDVEAYGGRTNGDRTDLPAGSSVTHRGGAGVYLEEFGSQGEAGKLSVEGGSLKAVGGEALADNVRGDFYEGGRGIRAYHSVAVSGGTVQSTGGASVSQKGGDGIFTLKLDITGAAASVAANGGTSLSGIEAGTGLYVTNDIVIDGSTVSVVGGQGMVSGYGIYSPNGGLTIKGGADVNASGGSGAAAGASGGMAVRVQGNIDIAGSSKVSAVGGAGQVNGAHGLFSDLGYIKIEDHANLTAQGGNGTTGVGGAGLRAFGSGNGSTVEIAGDAGDVYMRGGQGASVRRPAVIAKDVRIAAGNVGPIAMEGTGNPRSIKNKSGGDDVYLVTVTTNPAAATSVFSQVSGTLAGNYTYEAPTLADGLAYMWLPSGTQAVGAAGYQNKTPNVATDDTASTELTPLPVIAHLKHGSSTTDFTSIQAALDVSADGDTVTIEAGTYRDQLTVTKNITLQGAGIGQTIIESPNSNELVAANWKTLKNQTLYPVIGVKTSTTGEVVIKDLTIDGRKQGYIAAHAGDANVYTFNGIAVRDTSATIDQVKVIDVRDVYSDYSGSPVAPLPVDYLPQDQPSGANHNESILLEGAAGTGAHKVTVQNSEIVRFHKTGILAWGPALEVDIHDNKLQGHGKTLYSTGNGIQISSSDWSVNGGGDRRGTTGIVKDNEIYDIGLVIPEPGETGSYLNLGLGGPTGILLYQAGDGFVIEGNTITGPSVPSWHNSRTSNDGGYSNDGIGFSSSKDMTIRNNTITGFGTGIAEGGAVAGSTIEDNTFSANELDIWTLSGNDTITLGAGAETIAYNQTGNGIDTIDGFGAGDRLNVIGFVDGSVNGEIGTPVNAEYVTETGGTLVINGYTDALPVVDFTGGSVTAGDGTNVAARSVEVSVADGVTTLYIDTEGDDDAAELVIKLAGVYAPGNFKLNGGYISYITLVPATGLTVTSTDPAGSSNDGKTKIEATPIPATGHKLVYFNFGTGTVTIPNVGDTLPTYENLPNDGLVTAANGDNIGVAEVDANGKVVHFGQTTANVTAEPTPMQATGLTVTSTDPTGASNDNKTKLEATPAPATGHKLVYFNFGTGTVMIPNVGDTLPTYENLPSDGLVSAANGDNIGVAEVDANGKVVHFGQTTANVTAEPTPTQATGLTVTSTDPAGTNNDGKTKLEATPAPATGHKLVYYNFSTGTVTIPNVGDTLPTYENLPSDGLVSAANGDNIGVAEVDEDGKVVHFGQTPASVSNTPGTTPEAIPTAAISYSDEVLTGLTPGAEYLIGGVTKTAGIDGKIAIEAGWLGTSLSIVKVGDGTSTTNSAPQTLVVPSRPTTPTGVGKTDETSAGNDGTITGVTSELEYKKGTSGTWTSIAGTTVTGLAPDTYYVRTAATATAFASEATSVTVGAFTSTPETTPNAAISYSDEVLTGLTPGAEYLIGGVTKTAGNDGKIAIEAGWLGTSLSIVKVGNGTSTTDSAAQSLSIPSRPVAPVVTANDAANTIAGLALGMEYAVDGGSYVKYNGTNAPDLSGTHTVQVRTSATETALAGTAASLHFTPNAPAAPNVSANDILNTIVGADATMEYAIDDGNWVTYDPANPPVLSGDHTVMVRVKANGSTPAGTEKTILFTTNGTYSVLGTVVDDAPDANYSVDATVKVMKGNAQIGTAASTDANGHFKVTGVPNGTYNLVVTKGDQVITVAVTVKDQDYDFTPQFIVLPRGNKNSALEIKGDTPSVVVDGLNELFSDTQHVYTADDQLLVADGGSVKITLGVEKQDAAAATGASDLRNLASGQSIDLYLDMTLTKTRIDTSNQTTTTALSTVGSLLKIIVPYDLSGKTNVTLYRFHDGVAQKMTKLPLSATTPSSEGYMIDATANQMIIWAQNFSTYAVAYGEIVSTPGTVSVGSLTIAASADAGGSISPAGNVAVNKGGSQTFTIAPDAGYAISDVTVDGKSVGKVGSYTFNNVTEAHTIKAVFAKVKAAGLPYYVDGGKKVFIGFSTEASGEMKYFAPAGKTIEFQANPKAFGDIANHWGKSYIDFVAERELFVGVSDRTFAPNTGMTRAMLATVIGRLYERSYGPLAATGQHAFTDVNYDSWYGAYLDWAASNGIVQGVGGTRFDPDRQVTRQELAAMLYRFAQFIKADTEAASGSELSYSDASAIDAWARQAVLYGQNNGLITGRQNGAFAPDETATRAEVAAILKRFIESVV